MVREIGVDITPSAVLSRVHAHHLVAFAAHLDAIHLQVIAAAQRGGGVAQINPNLLPPPGAQLPQICRREPSGRYCRGTGLPDAEWRRQDGVAATGDLDRAGALLG